MKVVSSFLSHFFGSGEKEFGHLNEGFDGTYIEGNRRTVCGFAARHFTIRNVDPTYRSFGILHWFTSLSFKKD